MGNFIETVGHDIKVGAVDTAKVVAWPFTHIAKTISILVTALKDEPALQAAVTGLIKAAGKVVIDVGEDVAAKGTNVAEDLSTVADMQAFFVYFQKTFIPEVEAVTKDVVADLKTAS